MKPISRYALDVLGENAQKLILEYSLERIGYKTKRISPVAGFPWVRIYMVELTSGKTVLTIMYNMPGRKAHLDIVDGKTLTEYEFTWAG